MNILNKANEVLGINRRNRDYVENSGGVRRQQVDDKQLCKTILAKNNLPHVPSLFVVETRRDINTFWDILYQHKAVAIKPAQGSGGSGLMLLLVDDQNNIKSKGGNKVPRDEIIFHLMGILNGDFSNGNMADKALVEPIIKDDESICRIHEDSGLSDIRIVVYKGIMQMAMLRLPCVESGGAANLHAGGIGCGIDLESGHCSYAVRYDKPIGFHPDTGYRLANIKTPYWGQISTMMGSLNDMFQMNYLGIDLVIDERRGPLLLEVNARPGLAVQIANKSGLRGLLSEADRV